MEVAAHPDGLVVREVVDVDDYLAGIREMPYSWHSEALAAQAVAARTFLASNLVQGRSATGREYGYDICATDACQVYAGIGYLDAEGGERWAAAVERTRHEILVWDERPAETYYHSTSGGQTEAVQDVWDGAPKLPYLQGAPSPDEASLYRTWRVEISAEVVLASLAEAGYVLGDALEEVTVLPTEPGGGVWRVLLRGERELVLSVATFRGVLNGTGARLFPSVLPARRPDGQRYPQAILSHRFETSILTQSGAFADRAGHLTPAGDRPAVALIVEGRGWGHHIGMSQFGARAMAEAGADYREILAHYYGGLESQVVADLLPQSVVVGLAWEAPSASIAADGPFTVFIDGTRFEVDAGGTWQLAAGPSGQIALRAPGVWTLRLARLVHPHGPIL